MKRNNVVMYRGNVYVVTGKTGTSLDITPIDSEHGTIKLQEKNPPGSRPGDVDLIAHSPVQWMVRTITRAV